MTGRRYDPARADGRVWVDRWREQACSAWPGHWQAADEHDATELVDWLVERYANIGGYWTSKHVYFRLVDLEGDSALADFSPGYLWVMAPDYPGGIEAGKYRFVELSRFVARGDRQPSGDELLSVCPECFIAMPATGACDDHGRPD